MDPNGDDKSKAIVAVESTAPKHLDFDELFSMDPIMFVHRSLGFLEESEKWPLDDKLELLLVLNEFLEDTKLAREFIRLGRHGIVWNLLHDSQSDKLRIMGCRTIIAVSQNCPEGQQMFLKSKTTHQTDFIGYLSLLVREDESIDVKSRSLKALRWLLDHNDEAMNEFMNGGGSGVVQYAADSVSQDLHSNAARLISTLGPAHSTVLVSAGILASMVKSYVSEPWHIDKQSIIEAIDVLIGQEKGNGTNGEGINQSAVDYCVRKKVGEKIADAIDKIPEKDVAQDEIAVANAVVERLKVGAASKK